MIARLALAVLAALLFAVAPVAAVAQDGTALTIDDVSDAGYPTVEISVTVPPDVAGPLAEEAFTVTEDGRTVQPYLGDTPEDEAPAPPKVVLAIDISGSMDASIDEAKQAAVTFINSLPEDSQVAVVTFGDEATTLVPPTSSLGAVRGQIEGIRADDDYTALYAGVVQAAELLGAGGEPTSIIVLSDGDNTAAGDEGSAIEALEEHGIRLWAVGLPGRDGKPADVPTLEALAGDPARVLRARDAGELDAIYASVASNLSRTYVLRYKSEASGRTEIGVGLDAGGLSTQQTIVTTIDAREAPAADEPPPVTAVNPVAEVVTVPLLGTVGAFTVGLAALALGSLTLMLVIMAPRRPRPRTRERLTIGQQQSHRQGARLASIAQWTTEVTDRRLRRGSLGERLDRELEGAGLSLRPGELVVVILSMMVVAYAIGTVLASPILGLLLVPMPALLVRLWLGVRRDKRRARFSDQLTDVLQLVGSSLRAGYGLTQGIDAVSRDAEEPASSEFRRIIVEHRLGRDLNEAMENCASRMDNDDFAWVVQAISIHRDVGGDLSKVLDNIVSTIRDRADVHRQVRTLSAEGRMSARVLTGMPILVLILLLMMSPEYIQPMFENAIGLILLALAALLMIVGVLVMRRMSKIDY